MNILSEGGDYYLYVVFEFSVGEYSHALYRISLFDLIWRSKTGRRDGRKKKLKKLPKPILKLPYNRFPNCKGFFNVGPKIYIFGGKENSRKRKEEFSRSCYVFDTHNNPSNDVKDGPPMTSGKCSPMVLGPLNGKFYVFSYTLASRDLEEFNPETESWTALPPPPIASEGLEDGRRDYMVISYAIFKNRLFLSTDNKGTYTFDVISRKWEHLNSFGDGNYGGFPFNDGGKFLDGFLYACEDRDPVRAYHFDECKGFLECRVRGARHPSRFLKDELAHNVVPFGDRTLCVVRSGLPRHFDLEFCVTVDLYELTRFRVNSGGKAKRPKVSTSYSARYIKNDDLEVPLTMVSGACFVMGPDYDRELGRELDRDRDRAGRSKNHEAGVQHKRHAHSNGSPGRHLDCPEDRSIQNDQKGRKMTRRRTYAWTVEANKLQASLGLKHGMNVVSVSVG